MPEFDSAPTLNIPLARKVLEHLMANPHEHDQNHYGRRTACGTTLCIGGTAALFDGSAELAFDSGYVDFVLVGNGNNVETIDIEDHAARVLGLADSDIDGLFYQFNNQAALDRLAALIADAEQVQHA